MNASASARCVTVGDTLLYEKANAWLDAEIVKMGPVFRPALEKFIHLQREIHEACQTWEGGWWCVRACVRVCVCLSVCVCGRSTRGVLSRRLGISFFLLAALLFDCALNLNFCWLAWRRQGTLCTSSTEKAAWTGVTGTLKTFPSTATAADTRT